MKKILVAAAAILILATPASAEDKTEINGFLDLYYTIGDKPAAKAGKNPNKAKFVVEGEVDITSSLSEKLDVRIDLDVYLNGDQGSTVGEEQDSAEIEQAFFVLKDAFGTISVKGGAFNNPVGWEAEDATDLYQFSHGQIYSILDGSTALNGNNVTGIAFMGNIGMAKLMVATIDDLARTDEERSTLAVLNYTFSEGIDLEIGYVSQAEEKDTMAKDNTDMGEKLATMTGDTITTLGDIVDINITFKTMTHLVFAIEYLVAEEVIDHAYGLTANMSAGENAAITLRYDNVSYDEALMGASKDVSVTKTAAISYRLDENLTAILEYRDNKDNDGMGKAAGIIDGEGSQTMLEFIATF